MMKWKAWLSVVLLGVATWTGRGANDPAGGMIRVLIVTGQNNHEWRLTTPRLKSILEDTGRFVVKVIEDPRQLSAEALREADVLVSNWTGWPEVTGHQWGVENETAVVEFVRQGKGLVVFHAAAAAMQDWNEFQEIIGATWDLGKTGHGKAHAFRVSGFDREHPITRGLTDFWIHDELWHRIGRRSGARVIASAFSSKDQGGSGANEPVALVTEFGRGRGFNLVLGHGTEAMANAGWQTLMRRGVEWAARGVSTWPVPRDWPSGPAGLGVAGFKDADLQVSVDGEQVVVHSQGRVWLDYRYGQAPFKPYVRGLFTREGVNVLRDSPFDHVHHHGVMYALMADGLNFWEESPAAGRQRHRALGPVQMKRTGVGERIEFTQGLDWIMLGETEPILEEQRTIRLTFASSVAPPVLTWTTVLSVPAGHKPVELSGSHYNGLGLRFLAEFDSAGDFLNARGDAGQVYRGEERLMEGSWCAYAGRGGGKAATVAMFGHPSNARPTTWFTMKQPFAYLAATHRWHEAKMLRKTGEPLVERFGVAVWDGRPSAEEIEAAYQEWVKGE